MGALLNYLTDTSVAPLQRDLVEVCMYVGVWMCVDVCVHVCGCVPCVHIVPSLIMFLFEK